MPVDKSTVMESSSSVSEIMIFEQFVERYDK